MDPSMIQQKPFYSTNFPNSSMNKVQDNAIYSSLKHPVPLTSDFVTPPESEPVLPIRASSTMNNNLRKNSQINHPNYPPLIPAPTKILNKPISTSDDNLSPVSKTKTNNSLTSTRNNNNATLLTIPTGQNYSDINVQPAAVLVPPDWNLRTTASNRDASDTSDTESETDYTETPKEFLKRIDAEFRLKLKNEKMQ